MKLLEYIKDRIPVYVAKTVEVFIIITFLIAFKVKSQAIIVVTFVFVMTFLFVEIWEYIRKREFYNTLKKSLEELDKKYLLPELIEYPDFYEGKIYIDTLRECDKSMTEHVADYRRQNKDFREYIEMWVHEAKIPVASLRLMCHNSDKPETKMTAQIKRIDDYIENVLYYARSENAERDYVIKEVSIKKIFGSVAVKNREILQILDAQIKTTGLDAMVLTDGKWLEFIIGQLMANSIKYCSEDRQLMLEVWADNLDKCVIFHFKDNGKGIIKEDIPYIFEKTFTGHNGRGNKSSTGMGLYISKKLCSKLGHRIEVISEYGEYTEVRIIFAKNDFYKME